MPARRVLAVSLLSAALLAGGCGAQPGGDQAKRDAFLKQYKKLKDPELATLCPSLYPSDYLKEAKHYRYRALKDPFKPSPQQRSDAEQAGCTTQGTKPKK